MPNSGNRGDHLKRRGLATCRSFMLDKEGRIKKDLTVTGRRARKVWPCAAEDKCSVGDPIDWDEVYVEVSEGTCRYKSQILRYHMPCAMALQIIERTGEVEQGNQRRQAILMKKMRLQNASEADE